MLEGVVEIEGRDEAIGGVGLDAGDEGWKVSSKPRRKQEDEERKRQLVAPDGRLQNTTESQTVIPFDTGGRDRCLIGQYLTAPYLAI